jgi:transcriptional regulator with XRE-family HTH domain
MEARLKTSKLRVWRLRQGLSLEDVADLTGYSIPMLSRAERGERAFSALGKVRVARSLDVRVRDLFDIDPVEDEEEVTANDARPTRGRGRQQSRPTSR